MEGTKDNINEFPSALLRADITKEQKLEARRIAKKKGMTFKGWLGQLIVQELSNKSEVTMEQPYSQ